MADKRPIGLFDSGVGGLSVLLEIKKLLPYENFVFVADQKNIPYGAKTKKQIEKFSERITQFLIRQNCKAVVIACNTATVYALEYLRTKFKIPIIGVVPAIKPAAALSKNSKIAIMSTPATAKSEYLKDLVLEFAPEANVLKLGCEGLEDAVENLNRKNIKKLAKTYTQEIKKHNADVVVLGCTHFPFARDEIQSELGQNFKIIDSGASIAKRLQAVLKEKNALSNAKVKDVFYTTGDPTKFSSVASELLSQKIITIKLEI